MQLSHIVHWKETTVHRFERTSGLSCLTLLTRCNSFPPVFHLEEMLFKNSTKIWLDHTSRSFSSVHERVQEIAGNCLIDQDSIPIFRASMD